MKKKEIQTFEVEINITIMVDAEWCEGYRGAREEVQQLEPDEPAGWEIVGLNQCTDIHDQIDSIVDALEPADLHRGNNYD